MRLGRIALEGRRELRRALHRRTIAVDEDHFRARVCERFREAHAETPRTDDSYAFHAVYFTINSTAWGRLPGSPSNNHTPNHDSITKQKGGRVRFAALLSAPSSSFRPSDRKPLVRALTVLVLSIVHPSFQPRLNHGKNAPQPFSIHSTTTFQPRANHPSGRIQERHDFD